jgi:hypothetical protein
MKYEKICLMLPTYKRIDKLTSFIDSAFSTADTPSKLYFSFCVNEKDTETIEYLKGRYWLKPDQYEIILENTRQPNLALYFNKMYNETKFTDAIVSELGDDMLFITPGWDTRITETINAAEGNCIVYFNDDYVAQEKCCVNMFVTRELVQKTMKEFMCPFFHADMIDMVWTMIGAMVGILRYQHDIIIQHNHSSKLPKEKWDETFQRLSPVQKAANAGPNRKLAVAYATLCAKNLIDAGVGSWNTLS